MARFGNPLARTARIERILERERLDDPLHFPAPTRRELRTQAVHRLQIGLLGLAAILLLIALASAIMQHARLSQEAAVADPSSANARAAAARPSGTPGDPLADMGVAPEMRATRVPGPTSPRIVPQDPARAPHTP